MDLIIDFAKCTSPFPFYADGQFYNGREVAQPKYCSDKCEVRDCTKLIGKPFSHHTCSKGFSCYPLQVGQKQIVLNGLITSGVNNQMTGDRRKNYRQNIVEVERIARGVENIHAGHRLLLQASNQGAKDSVAHFHDIRTSVGVVLSWCEQLIDSTPGINFEQKLKGANEQTRNLFGSINLLQEQLELADIIANPSAITYGQQKWSSLTKFWYRMVKLFEPRARSEKLAIYFWGKGEEIQVKAFNSIQFLPLILLDNAIKYSQPYKTIYVNLDTQGDNLLVAVRSFGQTVPHDFTEQIFEKNVRGPTGIATSPEGMGMGLFIARQIAAAHGFRLYYFNPKPEVTVGENVFILEIPKGSFTAQ